LTNYPNEATSCWTRGAIGTGPSSNGWRRSPCFRNPKHNGKHGRWLNASLGDAFRTGHALEDAKAALFDALNGPDGHANPFILLRLGETLVDLGDTERGVEYLLRAYMLDGERVFEADGSRYLKLLRDRNLTN